MDLLIFIVVIVDFCNVVFLYDFIETVKILPFICVHCAHLVSHQVVCDRHAVYTFSRGDESRTDMATSTIF